MHTRGVLSIAAAGAIFGAICLWTNGLFRNPWAWLGALAHGLGWLLVWLAGLAADKEMEKTLQTLGGILLFVGGLVLVLQFPRDFDDY